MRATVSTGPPAAQGTTSVTGRVGQTSCAPAGLANVASAPATAIASMVLRMIVFSLGETLAARAPQVKRRDAAPECQLFDDDAARLDRTFVFLDLLFDEGGGIGWGAAVLGRNIDADGEQP